MCQLWALISISNGGKAESKACTGTAPEIRSYLSKISGPLLDRIDIHIEVHPLGAATRERALPGESSETVQARVVATRARQARRGPKLNARLRGKALREACKISEATQKSTDEAKAQFSFSQSRTDSLLRVARTIADMVGSEAVEKCHFEKAVNYRPFCIAAWTDIDDALLDNGCLYVVPGSHRGDILCPSERSEERWLGYGDSHIGHFPRDQKPIPVEVPRGSTMFFGGNLIHGSGPNQTADRWRRTFIRHYIDGASEQVASLYHPVLNMDGEVMSSVEEYQGGGPCGDGWGGAQH